MVVEKRRAQAQAFNYAPGEDSKVLETAEKRKTSQLEASSGKEDVKTSPGKESIETSPGKEDGDQEAAGADGSGLSSPDVTLPETSVDESMLNTSADSTGIMAGFLAGRKGKKDKKEK